MYHAISRRAALAGLAAATTAPALAKAPFTGPLSPEIVRFGLGGFEITSVLDGGIERTEPHKTFGTDQEPAAVADLLVDNLLPPDRMRNQYTPVIVNTGEAVIAFDTGNGQARRPERGFMRETLAANGIAPEQVDIVVLTHFHPDHIGGIMEDGAPAYPNARYVTGRTEFDWWRANSEARGEDYARLLENTAFAVAENTTFLEDGQDVVSGVTMVAAPGHTPGHALYHIESDGARFMVCADFCNHPVLSLQRPDWHVRFDMDKDAGAATRRRVLDMLATERVPFTSYHMPFPAIGYVDRAGETFRYVPETYQLDL